MAKEISLSILGLLYLNDAIEYTGEAIGWRQKPIAQSIEVGDNVNVRYKSINGWNEGYKLSGEVKEIKGDKCFVDLPFASRNGNWYRLCDVEVWSPKRMPQWQRDRINELIAKNPSDDEKNEIVSLFIDSGDGRVEFAQMMVAPIRAAVNDQKNGNA
jgi:hypothetical protein